MNRRFVRLGQRLLLLIALSLTTTDARAQSLSIQGDRFAIDGVPKFLTFITYFGAMGAPDIPADFRLLKNLGFDGIRIWPNLDTGPQLMNGDGSLRPAELSRLLFILDQASLRRLIVDVTFTHEHIAGMTPATTRVGILNVTTALRSYDNLIFDLQNERNVQDSRFMSEGTVASILAGIKSIQPSRIVTASEAPVDDVEAATDFTTRLGLDVTAYHEPRPSNWFSLGVTEYIVRTMRSNGKPAYLQEPMTTRDDLFGYPAHDRAEYFMQAIAHAKLAGAAAWCFHTEAGVDFRTGPPLLEDRFRAYPEPEWAFVTSLIPRVALQTSNGFNYLVAQGGGGGAVRADRTASGPGSWLLFSASVLGGGPLLSGDRVAFATGDGVHYLQAVGGGGGSLRAAASAVGPSETFVVEKPGGGVILHGDPITLRLNDGPWYVVAEGGGGGNVFVNSASPGPSETFRVMFVSPHISDLQSLRDAKSSVGKR